MYLSSAGKADRAGWSEMVLDGTLPALFTLANEPELVLMAEQGRSRSMGILFQASACVSHQPKELVRPCPESVWKDLQRKRDAGRWPHFSLPEASPCPPPLTTYMSRGMGLETPSLSLFICQIGQSQQ